MSHLKLVKKTKPAAHPRPIQVYYFSGKNGSADDWSRRSRATTPIGALRAAVVNVLIGKYGSADIYGEDGLRKYLIRMHGRQLVIIGYFGPLQLVTK